MNEKGMLDRKMNEVAAHPVRDPGSTKTPISLLMDLSQSLEGYEADLLKGAQDIIHAIKCDDIGKYGIEINLITFNDEVTSSGYGNVMDLHVPEFVCDGMTCFYKAIERAEEDLITRRQIYKDQNIHHNCPIYFIVTDGCPTDDVNDSYYRLKEMKEKGKIQVISIAVGDEIDADFLKDISNLVVKSDSSDIRNALKFVSYVTGTVTHTKVNQTAIIEPQKFGLTVLSAE